jgi:hypothetical protein
MYETLMCFQVLRDWLDGFMVEVNKNIYVTIRQLTFLKNALFSSNSVPHIGAGVA